MNRTEAITVLDELKVFFPDWERWAKSLPNKNGCLRNWCDALETQELSHISAIFAEWKSGKRQCPQTYDYERLIFILVAAARELRNADSAKEMAREATKSYHQQAAEAAARRAGYRSPIDKSLGTAIRQINAIADSVGKPKSQWTDEDRAAYFAEVDKITESFARTLDKS